MSTCAQHPDVPASYRCDGCGKTLCEDCIEHSHALFLCRLCGELAVPLDAATPASPGRAIPGRPAASPRPATPQALRKQRKREAPYTLQEALLYPFRGTGLFLYIGTVLILGVLWATSFVAGCASLILRVGLWGLIVGLQFKIVRSTAEGDNEIPDWPDFTNMGTMIKDFATWIAIHAVQIAAMAVYGAILGASLLGGLVGAGEPRLFTWLVFAAFWWVAIAYTLMAYGAAGNYTRVHALFVHQHIPGFLACGADGVKITNLAFGFGAVVLVLRTAFESSVPLLGGVLSGLLGMYWVFLVPHLAGLLFRRHYDAMEARYWEG